MVTLHHYQRNNNNNVKWKWNQNQFQWPNLRENRQRWLHTVSNVTKPNSQLTIYTFICLCVCMSGRSKYFTVFASLNCTISYLLAIWFFFSFLFNFCFLFLGRAYLTLFFQISFYETDENEEKKNTEKLHCSWSMTYFDSYEIYLYAYRGTCGSQNAIIFTWRPNIMQND